LSKTKTKTDTGKPEHKQPDNSVEPNPPPEEDVEPKPLTKPPGDSFSFESEPPKALFRLAFFATTHDPPSFSSPADRATTYSAITKNFTMHLIVALSRSQKHLPYPYPSQSLNKSMQSYQLEPDINIKPRAHPLKHEAFR